MIARTITSCIEGIEAIVVHVEVRVATRGFPSFKIVGLPDGAVKESKVRVVSALARFGYNFNEENVTVNLAPAGIRKTGTAYELAIAVGLLTAKGVVPQSAVSRYMFLGELSLGGELRPVSGVLPAALCARDVLDKRLLIPIQNHAEASVVPGLEIHSAGSLSDVIQLLREGKMGKSCSNKPCEDGESIRFATGGYEQGGESEVEFEDVRGQPHAKRALVIAAAGGHNLLMIGPPGSGKTMLAKSLISLLPPLSFKEALEVTTVYSVAGHLQHKGGLMRKRPFRSPHHSISYAGLIGGGNPPRPGEVSLAHNGVLFLDELPEYSRHVLDLLRQPLEDGYITISRAWGCVRYPARFTLVAAMNPCPCGERAMGDGRCRCTVEAIRRYTGRVSGPILDRIDMIVSVSQQKFSVIASHQDESSVGDVKRVIESAREIQKERFAEAGLSIYSNSAMNGKLAKRFCRIDRSGYELLGKAAHRFALSARACVKILKVARTIADLEGSKEIGTNHLLEALQFRMDRRTFYG